MSQYVEAPTKAFTAGGAIAQFSRVTLSAGSLVAAGANAQDIGTLCDASFASGDMRAVRLPNASGSRRWRLRCC